MNPTWPTRMRQNRSSMKTLNMLSPLFSLQSSSSFLLTLMQELDDKASWEGELGKQVAGKCNSSIILLLQTYATHNLLITNTLFHVPTHNKTSWIHPRSKHWHLIDHVIVRRRDWEVVRVTKFMCGAECWTDNRLIISKLSIKIQPKKRPLS